MDLARLSLHAAGKVISVMLTARELVDPMFLDAINSLLVSGEYAHIFSNDELEGLLQVSASSITF